ncbi:DUF1176 domain-containing protein [Sinorhizobium fredii]|nr:DUF1176 domain-containing protein [Sinorhizobium fredii]
MRSLAKAALALALWPSNAVAQEMAYFGNWAVGCDNLRSCSAIGLSDEGAKIGFVKIERGGEANAAPLVTLGLYEVGSGRGSKLEAFLDDRHVGGHVSEHDDVYMKALLTGEAADAFVVALGKARQLRISRSDGTGRASSPAVIAAAGSVPSLRFVDDRQTRSGTVTALVNKGRQSASRVPAVPEAPLVVAKPIQIVEDGPPPASIANAAKDADILACPDGMEPIVARLSARRTLWGICNWAAAYNIGYSFFLVAEGQVTPVAFEVHGSSNSRFQHGVSVLTELVNPSISRDGLTLSATNAGRGAGDCGEKGEWAWDGERFQLLRYSRLDTCRGIVASEWPVTYRASRK